MLYKPWRRRVDRNRQANYQPQQIEMDDHIDSENGQASPRPFPSSAPIGKPATEEPHLSPTQKSTSL